jgi:IPT/TIG domain
MSIRTQRSAQFATFTVLLTSSLTACGGGGGTGPTGPTPASIVKASGDQQTGATSQALAAPLVVQVNDRNNQPVAGVAVGFAVQTGGGSVNPTSVTTGTNGRAQTSWTLGPNTGVQTATASVTSVGSVSFNATAQVSPTITSVTPDTLIEGQSATITGANFSATPANDIVTVSGVQATVTSASTTSLTVTVPSTGCAPARLVTVSVQVGGVTGSKSGVPLHPAGFLTLTVGQAAATQDPARFCVELRAAAVGPESYLVGLSAPAETPTALLPFTMNATSGISAAPPVFATAAIASKAGGRPGLSRTAARASAIGDLVTEHARLKGQLEAEQQVRRWEATNLLTYPSRAYRGPTAARASGPVSPAPPAVGSTITLHVPNIDGTNACMSFTTIQALVRVVGSAGIWVTDVQNPASPDTVTTADIQVYSDSFDARYYATDTSYFGHPSDLDNNGRVLVVMTWQVNKMAHGRLLGFVFAGDLFPPAQCAESNVGEMYYGEVPDPNNTAGTIARTKATVLARLPHLISHEFTHVIQFSQRLVLNSGVPLTSWEAEGQATLAEELVGDTILGNTSGQNYGRSVAFGTTGFNWYIDDFSKLSAYFGDTGSTGQVATAPDQCTLFGSVQLNGPCDVTSFYGASWSFQRYVGDQFGPTYTGGLHQLTRDWITKNVTLQGTANVQALLGLSTTDTLFVNWAGMLVLDDLNNGTGSSWVPAQFRMTSWNLASIDSAFTQVGLGWINPPVRGYTTFADTRAVRGGSTSYTLLITAAAHPALAIALTDPSGNLLSTGLRPFLWIVRVQ